MSEREMGMEDAYQDMERNLSVEEMSRKLNPSGREISSEEEAQRITGHSLEYLDGYMDAVQDIFPICDTCAEFGILSLGNNEVTPGDPVAGTLCDQCFSQWHNVY